MKEATRAFVFLIVAALAMTGSAPAAQPPPAPPDLTQSNTVDRRLTYNLGATGAGKVPGKVGKVPGPLRTRSIALLATGCVSAVGDAGAAGKSARRMSKRARKAPAGRVSARSRTRPRFARRSTCMVSWGAWVARAVIRSMG